MPSGPPRRAELEKYNLKALVKTPGLGPKQRRQLDKLRHQLQECSQALRQVWGVACVSVHKPCGVHAYSRGKS